MPTFNTRKLFIAVAVCAVSLALLLAFNVLTFEFSRSLQGIYVTWDARSHVLTIQDDIYLEEQDKLLVAVDFGWVKDFFTPKEEHDGKQLDFEWSRRNGSGFVRSVLGNSRQEILLNFGRFIDDRNRFTKGLFVGGSPPYSHLLEHGGRISKNESGITYFDGDRWYHIWCNANEGIVVFDGDKDLQFLPSQYLYDGSEVAVSTQEKIAIVSYHHLPPPYSGIVMTRAAVFRENEPYFTLAFRITNRDNAPVRIFYAYGDEPWVGNFGTCYGNVGWTEGLLHYYEKRIDTVVNSFIGMADYGNPVIFERGPFTQMANFIEWHKDYRPAKAVLANSPTDDVDTSKLRPLASSNARSIMLSWGPEVLDPGMNRDFVLAIGMARPVAGRSLPMKPAVMFDMPLISKLLHTRPK